MFSITARGTRDEVLVQLGYQPVTGQLGADVLSMLVQTIRAGADKLGDDQLEYEVYANGHEDGLLTDTSVPNLAVRLTVFRPYPGDPPGPHSREDRPASNQGIPV